MSMASTNSNQVEIENDTFVVEPLNELSINPLKTQDSINSIRKNLDDLVTSDTEQKRSKYMQALYNITHPKPEHYTFNGLLVPPPPYSFGELTEESQKVAREMLVQPKYRLVHQSDVSSYHFELNNLYLEVAFTGRANCGKSSLLNALLGQQKMCRSTTTPCPNRKINYYQSVTTKQLIKYKVQHANKLVKLPGGGLQFTFVDLPGWGLDGMKPSWTEQAIQCNQCYLGTRRSLNTIFYCKDATQGWTPTDERYFEMIQNSHGMCFVVLTKCDAVDHFTLCQRIHQFYCMLTVKKYRHRAYPLIIPTSSTLDGGNHSSIDFLRRLIVETSGVIHGTKLRKFAMEEHKKRMDAAMSAENARREHMIHAAGFSHTKQSEVCGYTNSMLADPGDLDGKSMELCYAYRKQKCVNQSVGNVLFELDAQKKPFAYDPTMGIPPSARVSSQRQVERETESAARSKDLFEDTSYSESQRSHPGRSVSFQTERNTDDIMVRTNTSSKQNAPSLRYAGKTSHGAIHEENPDGSLNGTFISGRSVSEKCSPQQQRQVHMTTRQWRAYRKFSGKTLEGRRWDAYVKALRTPAYSNIHFTRLERRLTGTPRRTADQLEYEEKKVSWKAQPPGLARNYGADAMPTQFPRVIGA